jgi:hypothetical protein
MERNNAMYNHRVKEEVIKAEENSNHVKFAKEQLKPWLESDDESSVQLAHDVLDLVTIFSNQNHSGYTATLCERAFVKLINFEPMKFTKDEE